MEAASWKHADEYRRPDHGIMRELGQEDSDALGTNRARRRNGRLLELPVEGRNNVNGGMLSQCRVCSSFLQGSAMPATQFDRDSMACWYAKQHLQTDPGIVSVYFLPTNADEREIRFVEVNELIGDRNDSILEPIDFGIDTGTDTEHKLYVLDVTPGQWGRISTGQLKLPGNWSLDGAVPYRR